MFLDNSASGFEYFQARFRLVIALVFTLCPHSTSRKNGKTGSTSWGRNRVCVFRGVAEGLRSCQLLALDPLMSVVCATCHTLLESELTSGGGGKTCYAF